MLVKRLRQIETVDGPIDHDVKSSTTLLEVVLVCAPAMRTGQGTSGWEPVRDDLVDFQAILKTRYTAHLDLMKGLVSHSGIPLILSNGNIDPE